MKNLARRVWSFVRFHVAFFIPVRLPELDPRSEAGKKFRQELKDAETSIIGLPDDVVAEVEVAWAAELGNINQTLDTTRIRASQLLTVTGLVTAIAGLITHLPNAQPFHVLAIADLALLLYCIVATLWLTLQAIRVHEWNVVNTPIPDPKDDIAKMRRDAVVRCYRTLQKNSLRLECPVGYLKDAFVFFGLAVLLLIALVGFQLAVAPTSKPSVTTTPTPTLIPIVVPRPTP